MSLHLEFEPHSWYMGFAIKQSGDGECERRYIEDGRYHCYAHGHDVNIEDSQFDNNDDISCEGYEAKGWQAFTDNGNTYRIDELEATTLKELKQQIKDYYRRIAERDTYNRQRIEEKQI